LAKSLLISFQYNIESVCFFYSNPVLYKFDNTQPDGLSPMYSQSSTFHPST